MKKIICVFILMFLPGLVYSTAQAPDVIKVKWKKYNLQANPLEEYLEKVEWVPPKEAAIWSSNWRGYLAEWQIKSKRLFLVDMTIAKKTDDPRGDEERVSVLSSLFPNQKEILAKWYSGALILPYGKLVNYVHMGYGSTYKKYRVILIEEGRVIKSLKMNREDFLVFRDKKFESFKGTDLYKREYKNLTEGEYNWSSEQAEGFLQSFYAEHYLSL